MIVRFDTAENAEKVKAQLNHQTRRKFLGLGAKVRILKGEEHLAHRQVSIRGVKKALWRRIQQLFCMFGLSRLFDNNSNLISIF